jgi:hypothetical protein
MQTSTRRTDLAMVMVVMIAPGAGLLYGCSSTGGGAGGASGGGGGAAGAAGAGSCDRDLTGTWDLYATSLASGPVDGVMVVSASGFDVTTSGGHLVYNAQGTKSATWTTSGPPRAITVQNTPGTVNGGSIPVAVGGHWTLASGFETCILNVASNQVTGRCSARPGEDTVSGRDWPYSTVPTPQNGLNYLVARASTSTSQFGDFGGVWIAGSDSGSGQGCTITLQGNTITTDCHAGNDFNGIMHLTIGSDCVASGTTPSGLEVSARRR